MKVEVSFVAEVLKKHEIAPSVLRSIIEDINHDIESDDGDEKQPPVKKQHVIIISDPAGKLSGQELVGWVAQIPETASPHSTMDRVFQAAYDFNASKRGRMLPVKSVGEALESASAKYFKQAELWVKTKMPVAVIVTDNQIPKEEPRIERVERRVAE